MRYWVNYSTKGSLVVFGFYKVKAKNEEQAIYAAKEQYIADWYEGPEIGKIEADKLDFSIYHI